MRGGGPNGKVSVSFMTQGRLHFTAGPEPNR